MLEKILHSFKESFNVAKNTFYAATLAIGLSSCGDIINNYYGCCDAGCDPTEETSSKPDAGFTPDLRSGDLGADISKEKGENAGLDAGTDAEADAGLEFPEGQLAFRSGRDGNFEIYIMNADGSGQTNLTNNPAFDSMPKWSPDGTKIAFESDREGSLEIYVMNADGSGQIQLTDDSTPYSTRTSREFNWSPDGSKIVFISYQDETGVKIFVMNADGTEQTRLSEEGYIPYERNPSFSPDGNKIIYEGNNEIYVMNTDGNEKTNLTNNPSSYNENPKWSPDGTKILFRRHYPGSYNDIFTMNPDGSDQRNLTNNYAGHFKFDWSPDSSQIVFETSYRSEERSYEISLMNNDGSGQTNLTDNPAEDRYPKFSPNGNWIAFRTHRNGNAEIYVMDRNGENLRNLSGDNTFNDSEHNWRP